MKLIPILKEKLDNNEYQMVDGIIDILNQVKDISNRKEIADTMVQQFKDENIVFDYSKFYKAIGCETSISEKYHYDTGISGDEKTHAEKEFNQHHRASMYAKHFGISADKETVDFDDADDERDPGKVIPYNPKNDKTNRGYEPLSTRKLKSEYHHNTPNERIKSYTDRIKSIKDKMSTMQDKTSDTYKLQQGKLKAVAQTLLNYKNQQNLKKGK